jgi:hypothetical protein
LADQKEKDMPKKATASPNDKQQVAEFRKAARELGCDESEEGFQEALRLVAKNKPQPQPKRHKASSTR